jgi:hypothetical protein
MSMPVPGAQFGEYSRAFSRCPTDTNQCGVCGTESIPITSAAPHVGATRMPVVTASWLKDTSPPRTRGGAISEMYSGATKEAVPTASPRKNRSAWPH